MRSISLSSSLEKARRMSLFGQNKIGRYVYLQKQVKDNQSYYEEVKELSSYIFKMIDYQLIKHIDISNRRVKECLELLQERSIIVGTKGMYSIKD